MLRCVVNSAQLTHHPDSHFADLMHIMSKQFEENIYQEFQEQTSEETIHIPSSETIPVLPLAQYGDDELEHLYPETYFQDNPQFSENLEAQVSSGMGSLEFSSSDPGPSGVSSSRVPVAVGAIERSSVGQPDSSKTSYAKYSEQDLPSSYHSDVPISSETYTFFSESVLFSEPNVCDIPVSTPLSVPDTSQSSKLEKGSKGRKRSIQTPTALSSSLTTTIKTSPGSSPLYKSFDKPRRGRRRGYRRGSYSLRLLNRPPAGNGEEDTKIEATETRDIQEEVRNAYVQITEQPRPKALRFRYICEGRSAGSIPGIHSTSTRKTFPSIRVANSCGPALVVVSCVTVNPPHRPHPHNLVGKEGCEDGVCSVYIHNPLMECAFSNLGIQCVKKRDIEASLSRREEKGIDPFQTGFEHRQLPHTIDLNSIRLCFQVYLIDSQDRTRFPLQPVVSDPIYDKKATTDLAIYKLSASSCCVPGGKEIILLCDKVVKDDIKVRFFEEKEGQTEWEEFGDFHPSDVHKQVAISFKTPKYKDLEVKQVVRVWIQLFRPSDKSTSEPVPFEYYPVIKDYKYFEDKILHVAHPSSKEALTSDSPVESMQGASDEREMVEDLPGTASKLVRRVRSSSSQSRKISKTQEVCLPRRQTRLMVSKTRERKLLAGLEDSPSDQRLGFDETYCPQSEDIQGLHYGTESSRKASILSRHSFATSMLPSAPAATPASSSSGMLPESEGGVRSLLDMDISTPSGTKPKEKGSGSLGKHGLTISIPDPSQQEEAREKSLSPNSESIKKLKHDIETLNKLSNL